MNFKDWYNSINGQILDIDWDNRIISVYDSYNTLAGICKISLKIENKISSKDLLKPNQINEVQYQVYLNGYKGHNWLHEKILLDEFSN
jgi:hypothetical protein